jgi:hypothetical protein
VVERVRCARLEPEYASLYPEIPAGKWLPAWQVASRRAERVWLEAGADALVQRRLLSERHFQFRGGSARPVSWYINPGRLSDPTPAELSLR